jgi:uncharacterized protein with ParB-like and HNH nuclease domain
MNFRQTTVLGLFDSSQKYYIIPVYQRAYSWHTKEWDTFLTDLKEQIRGNNNYFYGNILLETIKKDIQYEVIDGQQRLTTLTIFMRSLLDLIKLRQEKEEIEVDIFEKEKIYLKNGGNIKLRPVDYDRACFYALIAEGKDKFEIATPSQQRIKEAKQHFTKELKQLTTTQIIKILEKIESTEITCIELQGKKDSALMFELQNNRGKDLTNMEKLKSYFMYQMYVYSQVEETETNIEYVSNIFKLVYMIINDLKSLNEDSILIYHCNAYIKGYSYRTLDDIKEVFLKSNVKVEWIRDFVTELHTSFSNMKKFEKLQSKPINDLRKLSIPAFAYPFFIKGFKYFGDDAEKLNSLFRILEVVVFRYSLINSRADIISRLNEILNSFSGNLYNLKTHFKDKFNEAYYWSDKRVEEYLNGWMYGNAVVNYLLWKYEDSLQRKGYSVGDCKITDEQIEHISPQTPTEEEELAHGYEVNENNEYDEEFEDEYLNSLGNLMLISGSHNSSIGNKPFNDKLNSYNANPLLKQQVQIKEFLDVNSKDLKWDKQAIDKRHKSIVEDFAIARWSFESIQIVESE